jgi:hypothetical protein
VSSPASDQGNLQIVGGAYREYCLHPGWTEVFGSGGRAASAAAALRARPHLSCYADDTAKEVLSARAAFEGFSVEVISATQSVRFDYDHGLATPRIFGLGPRLSPLHVAGSSVLRFGMLEGDAVVSAEQAVYDPQDAASPRLFGENGSRANRLALVLNRHEAQLLVGGGAGTSDLAQALLAKSSAEAIVIKDGARGALVLEHGGVTHVPAYQSASVWKIGSGDNFAAHFAVRWMLQGKSAAESADLASRATAYYCETRGFPDEEQLSAYAPRPVQPSPRYLAGYLPTVYLAGPFFNLAQVWLVDQARNDLRAVGLRVFSPFHDVGVGVAEDVVAADIKGLDESDIVFAIGDGMDPGTVFEVGYARAKGKPVVVYCETPSGESHKMLDGTDCLIVADYVSAVYRAVWTACTL